jgi:hypothetical protein
MDVAMAVHGDDFTLCGLKEDLVKVQEWMRSWFDIKVRGVLGADSDDQKEVTILGRTVRWKEDCIEYEADMKHRQMILDYFGFDETTRPLSQNGDKEEKIEPWMDVEMDKDEAKKFRGLAARLNYMSQDCPDLQYPIKQSSRDMANPTLGSLASVKKTARYLLDRVGAVWRFEWQDEPTHAYVATDSDWGGTVKDRRSTSGGVWMLGKHCIKTWSSTQGSVALSSAEAELYAMVEGVTRAKGLASIARELGCAGLSQVVQLGVDSSAAKTVQFAGED